MIKLENISIKYDNKIAVENANFTVSQGDYVLIVGENGSGKSSIIKSLLGLVTPQSGKIIFSDNLCKCEIAYLPQKTTSNKDFPASVLEVVLSGANKKLFTSKKDKQKALENMEKLGITPLSNLSYKHLSGGQAQRVLLARALCNNAKILILDEPVNGLDPNITAELYDIIKNLNEIDKITIIMVSHDVKSGIQHASKVLHMGKKVLFFGPKDDYLNSEISRKYMWCNHNG